MSGSREFLAEASSSMPLALQVANILRAEFEIAEGVWLEVQIVAGNILDIIDKSELRVTARVGANKIGTLIAPEIDGACTNDTVFSIEGPLEEPPEKKILNSRLAKKMDGFLQQGDFAGLTSLIKNFVDKVDRLTLPMLAHDFAEIQISHSAFLRFYDERLGAMQINDGPKFIEENMVLLRNPHTTHLDPALLFRNCSTAEEFQAAASTRAHELREVLESMQEQGEVVCDQIKIKLVLESLQIIAAIQANIKHFSNHPRPNLDCQKSNPAALNQLVQVLSWFFPRP